MGSSERLCLWGSLIKGALRGLGAPIFGGVSVAGPLRLFRSVLTLPPSAQPAKLQDENEKKIKPEQGLSQSSVKAAVHPFKE